MQIDFKESKKKFLSKMMDYIFSKRITHYFKREVSLEKSLYAQYCGISLILLHSEYSKRKNNKQAIQIIKRHHQTNNLNSNKFNSLSLNNLKIQLSNI